MSVYCRLATFGSLASGQHGAWELLIPFYRAQQAYRSQQAYRAQQAYRSQQAHRAQQAYRDHQALVYRTPGQELVYGTPGLLFPTGLQGPTGLPFTTGLQGPTGLLFSTGLQGPTGLPGPPGSSIEDPRPRTGLRDTRPTSLWCTGHAWATKPAEL